MNLPASLPDEVVPLFTALEVSPDAVFVTDRHNRIVFWNRSAERSLWYSSDEAIGASCAEMLEGGDLYGNRYCSENCPVTQMAARGESVREFNLRLRAKDGRIETVDVDILHFAVPPPDRFYLAHILHSSQRQDRRSRAEIDRFPPPDSALISVRESPDARARRLTPREVEVLGMLSACHPTPEIASRLHISTLTARNHIQNILDKLEVHSKTEAVAFAFQKRIL